MFDLGRSPKIGQMRVIPNSKNKYLKNKLGPLNRTLTLRADKTVVKVIGMGDRCSFLHMALIEVSAQSMPYGKMSIYHPSRSTSLQYYLHEVLNH